MIDLIIPAATFAAFAGIARYVDGSWAAPGAFFTLVWLVQIVLSFVVPDYPVWSGTLWWILATASVLFLGSLAGRLLEYGRGISEVETGTDTVLVLRRPAHALAVCTLLGLAYSLIAQVSGLDMSVDRPPLVMQLLLPFHYAGPMLGGLLLGFGALTGRRRWLATAPLMPPAILAVLFTGRTALVAPILFWLAGYLAMDVRKKRGRVALFTPARVGFVAALTASLLIFAIVTYMFRIVRETGMATNEKAAAYSAALNWEAFDESWKRLRPSVFGNIYGFSYYFEDAWHRPPTPHLGSIIFAAPLDLFGVGGERSPFEQFEIERGVKTNVFTLFRLPVDDFGLWGSLLWWFVVGVLQGWAFDRVKAGQLVPLVLLIWFYVDVTIIGGFFFRYNSITMSYLIAGFYLWRVSRPTSRVPLPTRPIRSAESW